MKKRWNWIDTTIIVIILLVVIAFINKDKIINTGKKVVTSNEKDILIVLETDELTRDMVSDLKVEIKFCHKIVCKMVLLKK